ncbi:hypothetical protein L915_12212 [Phytophthora nicotianae]|uniref:Uncharacterized protein n=1 Tax=Phytophthora nicotianae TaxID=4792 RepID=W2GHC0_PHYNI|nr:hypothetical protein L915_12212 [Phytophthora nicotianae]
MKQELNRSPAFSLDDLEVKLRPIKGGGAHFLHPLYCEQLGELYFQLRRSDGGSAHQYDRRPVGNGSPHRIYREIPVSVRSFVRCKSTTFVHYLVLTAPKPGVQVKLNLERANNSLLVEKRVGASPPQYSVSALA